MDSDNANDPESREITQRIEVTGNLNPHDVEELYLELGRLARRHAIRIEKFQVEKLGDNALGDEP